MPAVTRSQGRGKHIAALNPIPCRQNQRVTLAQHMRRAETAEGRAAIREQLDCPNPLLLLQREFEDELALLKDIQRAEREQKEWLRKLFKKMNGRALQAYLRDEVVNLIEESSDLESSLDDYESPPPPGLGPFQLHIPLPQPPLRLPTPYPREVVPVNEEEELGYPKGCFNCRYHPERCEDCVLQVWRMN